MEDLLDGCDEMMIKETVFNYHNVDLAKDIYQFNELTGVDTLIAQVMVEYCILKQYFNENDSDQVRNVLIYSHYCYCSIEHNKLDSFLSSVSYYKNDIEQLNYLADVLDVYFTAFSDQSCVTLSNLPTFFEVLLNESKYYYLTFDKNIYNKIDFNKANNYNKLEPVFKDLLGSVPFVFSSMIDFIDFCFLYTVNDKVREATFVEHCSLSEPFLCKYDYIFYILKCYMIKNLDRFLSIEKNLSNMYFNTRDLREKYVELIGIVD